MRNNAAVKRAIAQTTIIDIRGVEVIIDKDDYERIMNSSPWRLHKGSRKQYFVHSTPRPEHNNILLHRYIMNCPAGYDVDHINGNTLDNRKSNLRICFHAQNQKNMKMKSTNTSGFKGVSRSTNSNKWRARITVDLREIVLGYFSDPQKAYLAYCEAAKKYHGEYGRVI